MSMTRLNIKFVLAFLAVVAIMIASYQWDDGQTTAVAARTVREAAPLILAALCGLVILAGLAAFLGPGFLRKRRPSG
jgi:hypothetical protein